MQEINEILNNETKVKILKEVLKYPKGREFSRRQIAKIVDEPQSTANRKIEELIDSGILNVKPVESGNVHFVSVNFENHFVDKLKNLFEKDISAADIKPDTKKIDLSSLENYLWEAADILRGSIDSSDYKNYIFGLLFLKRLSDRFEEVADELVDKKGLSEKLVYSDEDLHTFFLPDKSRWTHIQKQKNDIGATINKAFELIEDKNDNIENGVLSSIDFNDKERLPDPVLEELIIHFSKKRFRNSDLEDPDVFGRAYEYLIRQFADDAGKKGGEFYTPREVVRVLVDILDPQPGMRVYDPCCGSGGMLVYSAFHIKESSGSYDDITLLGQERNLNTWAICEMNMILHDLSDANIEKGDTLRNPKFREEDELMIFDRVIANPMWNQKKWSKSFLEDDPYNRFPYGLPPNSSADWTWVQHMFASLSKTGKMGVVLDNGVLFRGRSEGDIRKKFLENDYVECVVALPKNLFYNTSSPGCLLILNKDKPSKRKCKVLFIYAEDQVLRESKVKMFDELSNQNSLTEEGIEKIVDTYSNWKEEDHHSRVVNLDEIEENDWNLNVPRYVDATEPEAPIEVEEKIKELREIEEERQKIERKMNVFLEELGYS